MNISGLDLRTCSSREQREAAARKAGFESPEAIGPYMRTLIDFHRDTMGVAIK
jgi:hypothetical protein